VTVVTGHSVALNRRSHLFSTMSSLHDVLVHDIVNHMILKLPYWTSISKIYSSSFREIYEIITIKDHYLGIFITFGSDFQIKLIYIAQVLALHV
jgi:hypothetical protein